MGMANALAGEGPGYNYSIVLLISCLVFGYFHCIFSAIISVPDRCWNFDAFPFDFWPADKGYQHVWYCLSCKCMCPQFDVMWWIRREHTWDSDWKVIYLSSASSPWKLTPVYLFSITLTVCVVMHFRNKRDTNLFYWIFSVLGVFEDVSTFCRFVSFLLGASNLLETKHTIFDRFLSEDKRERNGVNKGGGIGGGKNFRHELKAHRTDPANRLVTKLVGVSPCRLFLWEVSQCPGNLN